jgi:hypothetical protein
MSAIRIWTPKFPRGHLSGLKPSNNATDTVNDIDIAVGECRSDDDTEDMVLASALTKRLDAAWVVGTNQGGRDTGSIADVTWHLFLIKNVTTGVVDALFSQSLTAPTMPSGYTVKRRLLSIQRSVANFSGLWQFKCLPGDYFQTTIVAIDAQGLGGGASTTYNMSLACIPVGFKILCHLYTQTYNTSGIQALTVSDPDIGGVSAIYTYAANAVVGDDRCVWTNTAATINYITGGGGGAQYWYSYVLGFYDPRGKS